MVAVRTVDGAAALTPGAHSDRPQRIRPAVLLAWGVAIVAPTLAAATVGLHVVNGDVDFTGGWLLNAALGLLLAVPGVLIARKRPDLTVGWLLCLSCVSQGLCGLGREYFVYGSLGGSVPGWLWVGWFSDPLWSVTVGALPLMLILFPDGQARPARSRALIALPVLAFVVAGAGHLLTGPVGSVRGREVAHPLAKLVPAGLAATAVNLGLILTLASLGTAVIVLVLRYRRSAGEPRQQLKWLVWAGSITAFEIATEFLPSNPVAPYTSAAVILLLRQRSLSRWCAIACSTSTSSSTTPWSTRR